jgi:DNA-binding beta-propeller fold protein YncE
MQMRLLALGLTLGALIPGGRAVSAQAASPLVLEARISLGEVAGRIDHLAFDPTRLRIYVAEMGNGSVGIVDLTSHRLLRTVAGFDGPQGIAYEPSTDSIYVASGGDGTVRIFRAADFEQVAKIPLGADADNVRVNAAASRVYVGYGAGALAVIDSVTHARVGDVPVGGHPESFQLDADGDRVFVNVPSAERIVVASRKRGKAIAEWSAGSSKANYPMAIDPQRHRLLEVFRTPPRLEAFDSATGRNQGGATSCIDSDDIFVDSGRGRIYVICGGGSLDVIDATSADFSRLARLPTPPGSRTGLYIESVDMLVVAIRAAVSKSAELWLYRPGK